MKRPLTKDEWIQFGLGKKPDAEIGRLLSVSRERVRQIRESMGIVLTKNARFVGHVAGAKAVQARWAVTTEMLQKRFGKRVKAMINRGTSLNAVAKALGLTWHQTRRISKAHKA